MYKSHVRVATIVAVLVLLGSARISSAQSVTLFDDIYFGGASFSTSGDMSFVGWDWNDRISSLSVPGGMTVTVYQDIDFGGESLTLSGDNVDLRWFSGPGPDGTWNDQVSSIRVVVVAATAATPSAAAAFVNDDRPRQRLVRCLSSCGWTAFASLRDRRDLRRGAHSVHWMENSGDPIVYERHCAGGLGSGQFSQRAARHVERSHTARRQRGDAGVQELDAPADPASDQSRYAHQLRSLAVSWGIRRLLALSDLVVV
jgi:hypothetical protein